MAEVRIEKPNKAQALAIESNVSPLVVYAGAGSGKTRVLVVRYRRRSWKVAYNLVGNMEVARDISQEAFVRVLRGIGSCDPQRGFKPWFDRVVVNLSIDYLRKHRDTHRHARDHRLQTTAHPQTSSLAPGEASAASHAHANKQTPTTPTTSRHNP